MSVCYFVADQAGTSAAGEEVIEEASTEELSSVDITQQNLELFWVKVMDDIKKVTTENFKSQVLPLARIKKIMKLDEEVKMISAEAPVLFAKAAEIFIRELTMRAWAHTEDNKRRTLQRNDIAMAISKSDHFDFLIDIVPRHEEKSYKHRDNTSRPGPTTDQLAQQHQAALQNSAQQQVVLQPCTQVVQTATAATTPTATASTAVQQSPLTLVHQIVTPSGEVQHMPIQLTQAQLNMIRMQIQSNPNQPIILQTQPQQSPQPQIIQVTSQGQHQPQQQVFLQVATTKEDS